MRSVSIVALFFLFFWVPGSTHGEVPLDVTLIEDGGSVAAALPLETAETPQLLDQYPLIPLTSSEPAIPSSVVQAQAIQPIETVGAAKEEEFFTLDELKGEMKGLVWQKGPFRIEPYGRIIVDTVYETERSTEGDFILWVNSPDVQGEDAFYIDGRSTRVGVNVAGPPVGAFPGAKIGGKVEFDFQGQYVYKNKSGVLFRQAYIEIKHEDYLILGGQAWEVISPLYPGTLNYVPGSAAGNLGYRRAQMRGERYLKLSDTSKLILQGSLNLGVNLDFATDPTIVGGTAGWPIIEGRAAWQIGRVSPACPKPTEIGVSAHIGEEIYDFLPPNPNPRMNVARRTWSFNVDTNIPITKRLAFQAEFFTGENLSAYMGGILQGVDKNTQDTICSTGGWANFEYRWTPRFRSYAGYSLDDPFNQDLTTGRTYNQFFFVNWLYNFTDQFMVGLDVSSWKTNWIDKRPGEAVRFDVQMQYNF